MDITVANRVGQPSHQHTQTSSEPPRAKRRKLPDNWTKISELIILFAGTILVVAVLFGIYSGGPSESKYVNTSKFQAVFLNGGVNNGQVLYSTYFGHIVSINSQFLILQDVYYINSGATNSSSGTTPSNSVQLTKLGCQQLHSPYDQMVISQSEVAFWENLQSSGQVAQAITNYQKQNPNGPNCSQTTNSSTSPSTNNATNTSGTSSSALPSTSSTTTPSTTH